MAQNPVYLDEQGNEIKSTPTANVYLDEQGNEIKPKLPDELVASRLAARQASAKADFEANQPPSTPWTRAKSLAYGALAPFALQNLPETARSVGRLGKELVSGNISGAVPMITGGLTEPIKTAAEGIRNRNFNQMAEGVGGVISQDLPAVYGAGKLAEAVLPSRAAAGVNFNKVAQAAGSDVYSPAELDKLRPIVQRAQQLKAAGQSFPPTMGAVESELAKPNPQIPYSDLNAPITGRDLASAAGERSIMERLTTRPTVQRQMSQLASALDDANRAVAYRNGVGDLYDQAMMEYRNASRLRTGLKTAGALTVPAVIGGTASRYLSNLSKILGY